jgi:hypothetical protein
MFPPQVPKVILDDITPIFSRLPTRTYTFPMSLKPPDGGCFDAGSIITRPD